MREYKPETKNIIATTVFKTPLGYMFTAATQKGICLLSFYGQSNLKDQIEKIKKFFNAETISAHNKHFDCLEKELNEYFEGKRTEFTVPLQLVGTPFQQEVWKILLKVPYGETISYKEQAQLLKKPKAFRAVGSANGKNLISIIVPCHRIITSSGKLGGYAGGLKNKEALLELENNHTMV